MRLKEQTTPMSRNLAQVAHNTTIYLNLSGHALRVRSTYKFQELNFFSPFKSCAAMDSNAKKIFGQTEMQRVAGLQFSRSEVHGIHQQLQQQQKSYKHNSGLTLKIIVAAATRGTHTHMRIILRQSLGQRQDCLCCTTLFYG